MFSLLCKKAGPRDLRCLPPDGCPKRRFARSAMNYWVNCTTLTRTASPTWLRPLRRILVLLALYCYHRSHLHTRGLAIAGSCDQDDLVRLGGHVGAFLFARSREALSPAIVASAFITRRAVTLATGPLRKMLPIDDEPDEEGCEPV